MPAIVLAFIAPFLALYVKFRLVSFAIKASIFIIIYVSFKETMQWVINTVLVQMDGVTFPCMAAYIINSLDILPMANFALSVYATIYIGKFLYGLLIRIV